MKNLKIIVEYDGSSYFGWQIQPDKTTIQGLLSNAVAQITNVPVETVSIIGSGRTDAGVHALGQTANFFTETKIPLMQLKKGLNSVLPNDVVIRHIQEVSPEFNSRKNAISKKYRYIILNRKFPTALDRNRVYYLDRSLDLFKMKDATKYFVGEKDFASFMGSGSDVKSTIRRVNSFEMIILKDGYIVFEITATGFLKHMVRNIMGTIIEIGLGKKSIYDIDKIFKGKNRMLAGPTAAPYGLYLVNVNY